MNLNDYDIILVNSSAGKDSQAMLDYIVEQATAANVRERVVVVHCDLGRVEWAGTKELAERQARHYNLRFEIVKRQQDLLSHVEQRRKWPSSKARYCTSDHKRAQVYKLLTKLTAEAQLSRPIRILNCMGLRAAESPARKKKPPFVERDTLASNGKRHVSQWLPIHDWTTEHVWQRINASGVEHHQAYDLGMSRLSCCFCIFAPAHALMIAGRHNRELLNEYAAVEERIGHTFRLNFSIASIRDAIEQENS